MTEEEYRSEEYKEWAIEMAPKRTSQLFPYNRSGMRHYGEYFAQSVLALLCIEELKFLHNFLKRSGIKDAMQQEAAEKAKAATAEATEAGLQGNPTSESDVQLPTVSA